MTQGLSSAHALHIMSGKLCIYVWHCILCLASGASYVWQALYLVLCNCDMVVQGIRAAFSLWLDPWPTH